MKIYGDENNTFILKELGQRIKDIRIRRAMTQADLSDSAGVSFSTVVRIENGEGVNIENFMRVMRALNLLQNFNVLVPDQELTPEEFFQKKHKPKRVSKLQKVSENDWVWGDEKE